MNWKMSASGVVTLLALLIGARELRLLRPGAYLVNCAGGRVIDKAALLAAIDQGSLAGAALDIFSQEPIGDDPVLRRLLGELDSPTVVSQLPKDARGRGGGSPAVQS